MQKNDVSEPKFVGVCSRSDLPKTKDGTNAINLHE